MLEIKTASKECKMNRNLRWSIGMTAILLAMFAYTSQADAQSTYLPQYQSSTGYQSFNGRLVTSPQLNPTTIYSPLTYTPPASTLYSGQPQSQTPNSLWTPQYKPASNYSMLQPTVSPSTLYSQKTIAAPSIYYPNTAQTSVCQGGS